MAVVVVGIYVTAMVLHHVIVTSLLSALQYAVELASERLWLQTYSHTRSPSKSCEASGIQAVQMHVPDAFPKITDAQRRRCWGSTILQMSVGREIPIGNERGVGTACDMIQQSGIVNSSGSQEDPVTL
jgi:hypothetical protein